MPRVDLSSAKIEKLKVRRTTLFWDRTIKGFVLRVTPAGAKTLLFVYRHPDTGRQVKHRLGSWTIPGFKQHRARAARMRGEVDAGRDPLTEEAVEREIDRLFQSDLLRGTGTVAELFVRFIASRRELRRAERTIREYEILFKRHVRPELGDRAVNQVTRADIAALHRRMAGSPVRANRTLTMLHTLFEFAIEQEMRPEGDNPCRRVRKYPETPRTRYFDDAELAAVLAALDQLVGAKAVAECLRLMVFTGCRGCEVRSLRWEQVDLERRVIRLPRTKTGKPRDVPLSAMAVEVLAGAERRSAFVFPAVRRPALPVSHSTVMKAWNRVRAATGLPDARPHDLRHSFATRAVEAGLSLPAAMLTTGHASTAAFMRYFEPNARAAREAADAVEGRYNKLVDLTKERRERALRAS